MVLPKMIEVRQKIFAPKVDDLVTVLRTELKRAELHKKVKSRMKIAITAGSRGIARYPEILAVIVEEVKKNGGCPFLVPAMGSHGGATPEGQLSVLRRLGVTPESVGAPIHASMEVDEIGRLGSGEPVYVDRMASKADAVIVVNRVKPHTDFKGNIESGLMKMIAVGLGKQKGAEAIHNSLSEGYHRNISLAAKLIMKRIPIILGIAIVENAYHEIAVIKALQPDEIEKEEMRLLEKAKELLARIPIKDIDVLVVDEMGKDISGLGMDTNVTGRFWIPGEHEPQAPHIRRIVVLDLSQETHGNAIGIGLADLTTKKAVEKIDLNATFVNSLTACWPENGKIPVFLPNDHDAISTAIRICGPIEPEKAKVVRIKNTLELGQFWISEGVYESVKSDKVLSKKLEFIGDLKSMQFDVLGMLAK
jgi:hypothetical protein